MRFLKVVPAFFLIGFFAGSLETASGLGHFEQSRIFQQRKVDAQIVRSGPEAFLGLPLANELRAQAVTLPAEVLDGVRSAHWAGLPEELMQPSAVHEAANPRAPLIRSSLFLPEEPDWWERRHDGGQKRHVTFGPVRPVSLPGAVSATPFPEPLSLPPVEQALAVVPPRDDKQRAATRDMARQEFIMPFERGRVTSLFHQGRYHPAIDLAGRLGSPVHATTRGQRVTFTGWRRGYGNTVTTRDSAGRTHLYAHLQRVATRVGTLLDQGQVLGLLGSTGRSTGPHVHYEVRTSAGRHINPVTLLFPGRRIGRGYAWNGSGSVTRIAAR